MDKRQAQTDGDLTTALCSLPKIQSEDGQDYVQLYDVLETVRRYMPSVAIPNKTGHWKRISMDKYSEHAKYWYRCDRCGKDNLGNTDWCPNCGADMRGDDNGR